MNGFVRLAGNICVLLFWSFLVIFTNLSVNCLSTVPRQYKTNVETGRTDIESDLAFLRSRPHSLSSLLPVRPYSLSINEEDYHYSPKPKDLRPARLFRILGSSFDPFWMSVERPSESEIENGESEQAVSRSKVKPSALPGSVRSSKGLNLSASPELTEGAARYQRKLEKEAEDLDLSLFPDDATRLIRAWLVRSATCELSYQWVDLGPVFWPRWLRHTDCEQTGGSQSCSFPSGMSCRRAQVTHIKILAWHCWGGEEGLGRITATDGGLAGPGSGVSVKRCVWRQVPYPVVTACKCSCK